MVVEEEPVATVRRLLDMAVRANLAQGMLLSAGLDTSIVAALAARQGTLRAAVTVCTDQSAPDYEYARELAEGLRLKHHLEAFGPPRPSGPGKQCPDCHSTPPNPVAVYCRVCGAYPI